MKILSHPQFIKYTMWFMTGETAIESGQVAPALAQNINSLSERLEKK